MTHIFTIFFAHDYHPQELSIRSAFAIQAGRESSYFLSPNGSVQSCGRNNEGQLGDGTNIDSAAPVKVLIPSDVKIRDLGSGPSSASAFFIGDSDEEVFGVGQNYRYQLGLDEIGSRSTPELISYDDAPGDRLGVDILKITSSGTHTVAIACKIVTETPTAYPTVSPTTEVST